MHPAAQRSGTARPLVRWVSLPGARTRSGDALLHGVVRCMCERGNAFAGWPACLSCHETDGRGTADLPRQWGPHGAGTARLSGPPEPRQTGRAVHH